jgi:hypothetical protein
MTLAVSVHPGPRPHACAAPGSFAALLHTAVLPAPSSLAVDNPGHLVSAKDFRTCMAVLLAC